MTTPLVSFRQRLAQFVPRWLKNGTAARILYAISVHFDVLADLVVEAVRKRFPVPDSYDALSFIGADRKMLRGPSESDEVYASRVVTWLDAHATRGNPYTLLNQLFLYYAPNNFAIELVYASTGLQFAMAVNGTITVSITPWRHPDGDLPRWARWRLVYHWPDTIPDPGLWDEADVWDSDGIWDSSLSPITVEEIKSIPTEWNAAHCIGEVELVNGTTSPWDESPALWDDSPAPWDADYSSKLLIALD